MLPIKMIQRPGTYWHVFPYYSQARKAIWNGKDNEGRPFLDCFPPEMIIRKREQEMYMEIATPDPRDPSKIMPSTYQIIGADKPDSVVGPNPVGVIFSEYALMAPQIYYFVTPILKANKGWAVFISTPRGKNHFAKMVDICKKQPKWFGETLIAGNNGTKDFEGLPVVSDEDIDEDRMIGMSEALIQQEYYCSRNAPVEGAYYAEQMLQLELDKKITNLPYDPHYTVHTSWDLGMHDDMSIWFWQEINDYIHLIDYWSDSSKPLTYWIGKLERSEYSGNFGTHAMPWDGVKRDTFGGSRLIDRAKAAGLQFTLVKRGGLQDGINEVRALLPRCRFDEERCVDGIAALRAYHHQVKEEFQQDSETPFYTDEPVHDWASHGADSLRCLAMALTQLKNRLSPEGGKLKKAKRAKRGIRW